MSRCAKQVEVEQTVLELSRERVRRIFDLHDHVACSFSGGKDSTVVLNLCLEEAIARGRTPLDVIFYDEEAIPYETEDYVRRVAENPAVALRWYCLPVKHRNACSPKEPYWYPWDPRIPEKWVRPMPPEATPAPPNFVPFVDRIHQMNYKLFDPKVHGVTAIVLGIRAQESLMRRRGVLQKRGVDNYLTPLDYGIYKALPIYDWRTEDVWRAPKLLGWDYNKGYDRMDEAGISPHDQRCAPPFGEEPLAGLWRFKVAFPDIWEKLYNRVPGAATAARYSRTELYGFGGMPPKPAHLSWEDYIRHFLMKFKPEDRVAVAQNIQRVIRAHFKKTLDPIMPNAPHPVTGVSWRLLFKIAMRGNFKGRLATMLPAETPQVKERYERARREYDAAQAAGKDIVLEQFSPDDDAELDDAADQ